MRRLLLLAMLVLLLTAPVAADERLTVLHTEDREKDIAIEGYYYDRIVDNKPTLLVKYNMTLINSRYNKTTLTAFQVYLKNETGIVSVKDLDTVTLHDGDRISRFTTITADTNAVSITAAGFRANHTATLGGGGTVDRVTSGDFPVDIKIPDQTIESFTTNASTVFRGQEIYVRGKTTNINGITIQGERFATSVGSFEGWITVPTDTPLGNRSVFINMTTDVGRQIPQLLDLTVVNRPPRIDPRLQPRSLSSARDVTVRINARDEIGIRHVNVSYWNGTKNTTGGSVTLWPGGLMPGNYTIAVTATDTDGATMTANRTLTVTDRLTGTKPSEPEKPDGNGDSDELQSAPTDPVEFAKQFAGFLRDFVSFLVPGF